MFSGFSGVWAGASRCLAIFTVSLMLAAGGSALAQTGPDYDGNGRVDSFDLFEAASQWHQTSGGSSLDADGLLDFSGVWHTNVAAGTPTTGPTITPTGLATSTPTLAVTSTPTPTQPLAPTSTPTSSGSLPVLFLEMAHEVTLNPLFVGGGYVIGEATVTLSLSNTSNVASFEVTVPFNDVIPGYTFANVQFLSGRTRKTALTSSFNNPVVTNSGANRIVRMSGATPLGPGAGEVMTFTYQVTSIEPPHPTNVYIPITLLNSVLKDASETVIPHTRQDGSLYVNPDGLGTPTPGPTSTPTITPTPAAQVASFRLLVCVDEAIRGNPVNARVDLLDAQGRNINPGVQGGALARNIHFTLSSASGFARFTQSGTAKLTSLFNQPAGLSVSFTDQIAGAVTISATSAGLPSPPPVQVTFLPGGLIRGKVFTLGKPPFPGTIKVNVVDPDTGIPLALSGTVALNNENFTTSILPPGTYNLSVVQEISGGITSVTPVNGECIENITVVANQITTVPDINLGLRTGGDLTGNVTTSTGSPLNIASVFLYPNGTRQCGAGSMSFIGPYSPTPVPAIPYQFPDVPAGEYTIYGTASIASTTSQTFFLPFGDRIFTMGGSDQVLDLVLDPILIANVISPVNYVRVSSPMTFQWSSPGPGITYDLTLAGSCGVAWQKFGINGDSVVYDGPALSKADVYNWAITGKDAQNRSVVPQFTAQPAFVLE